MNKDKIKIITKAFKESNLFSRIVFLGNHGSSLYKEINDNSESDFDIELILDNPSEEDLPTIKDLIESFPFKVECQLRYKFELEKGLIELTSYKIFMFFVYANGDTLIGKNIYKDLISSLHIKEVKRSFLISAQIAFKDIRKTYISDKSAYDVNKNIMRFFVCTCFYYEFLPLEELGKGSAFELSNSKKVIDVIIDKFTHLLNNNDKEILLKFKDLTTISICTPVFEIVTKLANKIYNT